jgi:pilus assembly protein CpaC
LWRWTVTAACLCGAILPAVADGQTAVAAKRTFVPKWTSDGDRTAVQVDEPAARAAAASRGDSAVEDKVPDKVPDKLSAYVQRAEGARLLGAARTKADSGPGRPPAAAPPPQASQVTQVSATVAEAPADRGIMSIAQAAEAPLISPGGKGDAELKPLPAAPAPASGPKEKEKEAQQPELLPLPAAAHPEGPIRTSGPFEILDQAEELTVIMRRSKLLRSQVDISRAAVVDPTICDVVQFSPRECSIIGKSQGATSVTFWFQDTTVLPRTFLVKVTPDPEVKHRREETYALLEEIIAKLFPNSKVKLTPVGDKLLVTGQARDAAEAAQIMTLIRGEATDQYGRWWGGGRLVEGSTSGPLTAEETGRQFPASQVINMLRIPGVQQVALRVKIAELNRSAARSFGVDLDMAFAWKDGSILLQSLLNVSKGRSILGTFDHERLNFGIHYLEERGVVRMLSEPTLVTLSGRPASFVAGGEFAVPTVVGVNGASGITTDFRAFGAIITFLPVVIDKDHIRLEVSPEFSKVNTKLSVGGTPGLDTRSVTTTVEMREGQTLAIAGLLDDSMKNDTQADLPLVEQIFGSRSASRQETELLILVTPELVHPMDPEEVPPLPGFDVTEPNNTQFFLKGQIEGRPTEEYRSTVWPWLQHRYRAGGSAMISGPYGHGN